MGKTQASGECSWLVAGACNVEAVGVGGMRLGGRDSRLVEVYGYSGDRGSNMCEQTNQTVNTDVSRAQPNAVGVHACLDPSRDQT